MWPRPVGATPGSPPAAVWEEGRPPWAASAAKCERRGARRAEWRCDYAARESDHRALRTPRAARPVHPGLAYTRHETLQGIWGRLACTLRARDEGRSIPWRP